VTLLPERDAAHGTQREAVLSSIPAFPPVVIRVLDLLAREDVNVREMVDLILSDAVFSAQVLRLANSPLFGHRSRIDSLHHALVALGLKRVQAITMTIATANYMKAALRMEELRRCWRHTLACAILCQEIARASSLPEDSAYTAGLLHDIGRLGLLVAYPREYANALKDADRESLALLDQERRLFGMDHCEAGCHLAEKWALPPEFRVIAGRHHDPPSGSEMDMLSVVYFGCRLADVLGFHVVRPLQPVGFDEIRAALPEPARHRFPPDPEALTVSIESRIRSHDPAEIAAERPETQADPPSAAPEANPRPEPESPKPAPELFAGLEPDSLARDFTVVGITSATFTAVLLTFFYFWGR
jgi:putative nucleotidyltransferase with HDIG domain